MAISSISSVDTGAYQSVKSTQSTPAAEPGKVAATQNQSEDKAEKAQINTESRVQQKNEAGQSAFEITERQQDTPETNITDALKKAVEDINKNAGNSEAQFAVHEETNRIMIKIVDKSTKEVIKEFPPEKTLDLIAKAWELAGLTVDERR